MNKRTVRQYGLSLIELIIAMLIGIIILLAVVKVVSMVSTQAKFQRGQSISQDNSSFAFSWLEGKMRSIGSGVCLNLRSNEINKTTESPLSFVFINRQMSVGLMARGGNRELSESCGQNGRDLCINFRRQGIFVEEIAANNEYDASDDEGVSQYRVRAKPGSHALTLIYSSDETANVTGINGETKEDSMDVVGLGRLWAWNKDNYLYLTNCLDSEIIVYPSGSTASGTIESSGFNRLYPEKRQRRGSGSGYTSSQNGGFAVRYLNSSFIKDAYIQRVFIKTYFVGNAPGRPWQLYEKDLLNPDASVRPVISDIKDMRIQVGVRATPASNFEWHDDYASFTDWEKIRGVKITIRSGTGREIIATDKDSQDFDREYERIISLRN